MWQCRVGLLLPPPTCPTPLTSAPPLAPSPELPHHWHQGQVLDDKFKIKQSSKDTPKAEEEALILTMARTRNLIIA